MSERTPDNVRRTLQAFKQMLGASPMMAYLTMMTPRLIELHRVLKPTGSLYLHCDPTASHYLKIVLDTIFDPTNFRNEVTWKRRHGFSSAVHESNRFGNCTDTILFYGKSEATRFTPQYNKDSKEYRNYITKFFTLVDGDGRLYQATSLTNPAYRPNLIYEYKGYKPPANGWMISKEKMTLWDEQGRIHFPKDPGGRLRRKSYADELKGMPIQNLWDDIQQLGAHDAERLGYPTQKPQSLLRRIISASSTPGDVILDPFCGCGTAIDAAQELGRRWIGIDIAIQAIGIIEERLHLNHGLAPSIDYIVEGTPRDEAGARKLLARQGRYRFEDWALDFVRAEPWSGKTKRGKDRGRDGVIVFRDSETRMPHRALVQVKSGEDRAPAHVRDLRGTMEREEVEMGVFLTLESATPEMELEAATAGFYTDPATKSNRDCG